MQQDTNNTQDETMQDSSLPNDNDGSVMMEDPEFVSAEDAVEVAVDDDAVPMEDDDDEEDDDVTTKDDTRDDMKQDDDNPPQQQQQADDPHLWTSFASHDGPVYAVSAFVHPNDESSPTTTRTRKISVVTGGGDDKAFLHQLSVGETTAADTNTTTTTTTTAVVVVESSSHALDYAHTDSVSAVALNLSVRDATAANSKKNPRLAAVGGYDGAIVLYDADTGHQLQTLEGPTDVECVAFHPKGGTVLLAGSSADGTLWMYHIPLQQCLQVFVGHESAVTACQFTPDGKWAVSASSDGTVRIWAPRTGQCKHVFDTTNTANSNAPAAAGLTCMAVGGGKDGQLLVVGAEDGRAHLCHVATQKIVATLHHAEEQSGMASGSRAEEEDNDEEEQEVPSTSVEAVGFSPSHPHWCATGGVDGVLKIWDLSSSGGATCRQVCRNTRSNDDKDNNDDDDAGITRLQWHPVYPLCFTSTTAGTVQVWDARNGQLLQRIQSSLSSSSSRRGDDNSNNTVLNDCAVHFYTSTTDHQQYAMIVTGGDDHMVRVFGLNVTALWNKTTPNNAAVGVPSLS